MSVDYAPLLIGAVVVVGAVVVLAYLRRLKRAAVEMLQAAREMEASMESLKATAAAQEPPERNDGGPGGPTPPF